MKMTRGRRLVLMVAIAIVLIIIGTVTSPPAIPPPTHPGDPPPNLVTTLAPFMFIFVAIILAFIAFIIFLATALNQKIDPALFRRVEIGLIAGIIIGVVAMIQPFVVVLFGYGFLLLLACTIGFIIWSHLVPRNAVVPDEPVTTVSATEMEQREAIGQ